LKLVGLVPVVSNRRVDLQAVGLLLMWMMILSSPAPSTDDYGC
jgi:hypothetical protein